MEKIKHLYVGNWLSSVEELPKAEACSGEGSRACEQEDS